MMIKRGKFINRGQPLGMTAKENMNKFISIKNVFRIIDSIASHYPPSVFGYPRVGKISATDCYTAAGVRLAGKLIRDKIIEHATKDSDNG